MNRMSGSKQVDIALREARPNDARQLAGLMCELGYETTTAQMKARLRRILSNSRYRTFVAEADNELCGMIGMLIYPSYEHDDLSGRILALVVSAKARRRGMGRKLVAAAEKEFVRNGVRRVAVNTRLTRKEAHRFYEALGYQRNGFRFVKQLRRP
jgi:ribosomal protein S18 acetylase RimI-like enzyme